MIKKDNVPIIIHEENPIYKFLKKYKKKKNKGK